MFPVAATIRYKRRTVRMRQMLNEIYFSSYNSVFSIETFLYHIFVLPFPSIVPLWWKKHLFNSLSVATTFFVLLFIFKHLVNSCLVKPWDLFPFKALANWILTEYGLLAPVKRYFPYYTGVEIQISVRPLQGATALAVTRNLWGCVRQVECSFAWHIILECSRDIYWRFSRLKKGKPNSSTYSQNPLSY